MTEVLDELREIARGIHPAILTEGGLPPALRALARRLPSRSAFDIKVAERLPEPIEIAAYYAISEALTNTAKHAHASGAAVEVAARDGGLRVCVRDDGRGGADFTAARAWPGSRTGWRRSAGGSRLHSPARAGTAVYIVMPSGPGGPGPSAGAVNSPR